MCSSGDFLIFPGSWVKEGLAISLQATAKGCQHDGKAVTPCGPAMQQQMDPQHHGRGNIWMEVCWGMGDGSRVRAMTLLRAWASRHLKKWGLKPLWSPPGILHWNQLTGPLHQPCWAVSLGIPIPQVPPSFQTPRNWGTFPVPLCVRPCLSGTMAPGKHVLYF